MLQIVIVYNVKLFCRNISVVKYKCDSLVVKSNQNFDLEGSNNDIFLYLIILKPL